EGRGAALPADDGDSACGARGQAQEDLRDPDEPGYLPPRRPACALRHRGAGPGLDASGRIEPDRDGHRARRVMAHTDTGWLASEPSFRRLMVVSVVLHLGAT